MKKNKKGFTLIELLAVIVILGLLMAIAIPSITRYITQSRKKTAISTAQNYMSALINEVNALEYTFTGTDTVYAVPIECISVERGGKSPFGEWLQANNAYWGYVLVQYDELNSSYTYGFTFKDSAGYGMYPTSEDKIHADGSQIQTGLNLTRPVSGNIEKIAEESKWTGFDVDSNTNLIVLESAPEGDIGDGEKTCTLCQKGPNYDTAEDEKDEREEQVKAEQEAAQKEEDLKKTAYAIYSADDKSLTFVRSENPITKDSTYDGKTVTAVYTGFEEKSYSSRSEVPWYSNVKNISSVIIKDKIYPKSTSYWFYECRAIQKFDLANLNTSDITDMSHMFDTAATSPDTFYLDVSNWDTSNVTNMASLFSVAGLGATSWTIVGLEKWDTSKVTNMSGMFRYAGGYSTNFYMDLSSFNTSNVTNMSGMFNYAGAKATNFKIVGLEKWDVSKVTNMSTLFGRIAYSHSNPVVFDIGDLSNWDTSSVTNMSSMFEQSVMYTESFDIGDISKWNTSNVTTMKQMFSSTGRYSAKTFNIGDISKWDTSNVTDMYDMFFYAGYAADWSLDLSNWNVKNVISYGNMFNYGVTKKVIAPTWVN